MPRPDSYWTEKHRLPREGVAGNTPQQDCLRQNISEKHPERCQAKENKCILQWKTLF